MSFAPINTNAVYLPTTQYFPEDPQEFKQVITFVYSDIARRLNDKQIGIFDQVEFLTGEQWFTQGDNQRKRQSYRKVFPLTATAAGATTSIAHGISGVNSTTTFTHIYGACLTATPDNRPIPYASATAVNQQIEINVDATNVNVINGAAAPNITSGYVILEYLLN